MSLLVPKTCEKTTSEERQDKASSHPIFGIPIVVAAFTVMGRPEWVLGLDMECQAGNGLTGPDEESKSSAPGTLSRWSVDMDTCSKPNDIHAQG